MRDRRQAVRRARLFHRADAVRRRERRHGDRQGGDLRPGHDGPEVQGHRRSRRAGATTRSMAWRRPSGRATSARPIAWPADLRPARCGSTATTCSTRRPRSAASRCRASAASWAKKVSTPTPSTRRSPSAWIELSAAWPAPRNCGEQAINCGDAVGWLEWLFRSRAKRYRRVAEAAARDVEPLTVTRVENGDFVLVLPGRWKERTAAARIGCSRRRRAAMRCAFQSVLARTRARGRIRTAAERGIADDKLGTAGEHALTAEWTPVEVSSHDGAAVARCEGYFPARQCHVALCERVSGRRAISAVLLGYGNRSAGATFSNLATVIFSRLEESSR